MTQDVSLQRVSPRTLAAVRASVPAGSVGAAFGPPLDKVWAFLRRNEGLRTDGHNVFLYHHEPELAQTSTRSLIDFGVEVTRAFEGEGDVACVETPGGEAAVAVHRGPYLGMKTAHDAIHRWCAENGRGIGAFSWEIYSDWNEDPARLETTIFYLLRPISDDPVLAG
ncbi:MAG: GyrI-like domain-containing protein [Alphaproteobacteria bacterium]|nr:GyrI-like domain-containing protein [Alphaproteobacteria bacterium]